MLSSSLYSRCSDFGDLEAVDFSTLFDTDLDLTSLAAEDKALLLRPVPGTSLVTDGALCLLRPESGTSSATDGAESLLRPVSGTSSATDGAECLFRPESGTSSATDGTESLLRPESGTSSTMPLRLLSSAESRELCASSRADSRSSSDIEL